MATASTFRPVNVGLPVTDSASGSPGIEETTPTTPRPTARFVEPPRRERLSEHMNPITPTKHDFGGIPGQRALPETPFTPSAMSDASQRPGSSGLTREDSNRSSRSQHSEGSQDIEMADDDGEQDDSDNDSTASDSQRPRKKKKGQRFFCTDYPPCNLSFTRSEHLARHIRKHTGERPFQCHCSRRFSRLDNLRQHAQTVHVNEDIPGDSLAATGTRFQRQIRTDRVRPPSNRSRASTTTSTGGHSRGHSRNLSASSVASTASNVSSLPDEGRRRPPPLAMAQEGTPRARLTLETFVPPGGSPSTQYGYYQPQSPTGFSTPTSATFSTGAPSPRFSVQSVQSPSQISRSNFYNGTRAPGRRLSVPSAPVFQPGPSGYPSVYYGGLPSGAGSVFSNTSSVLASPTSSVYTHGRRESEAELDWRRRTWHPGTYASYVQRPATSGLAYQQAPDDSRPTIAPQAAASQMTRLPGIESFDHAPLPPGAAQPRLSSPMQVDNASKPPVYPGPLESAASGPDDRRNPALESGLHHNLNRLDIANATPPKHGQSFMEHAAQKGFAERPVTAPQPGLAQTYQASGALPAPRQILPSQSSADNDARRNRRQGWYGAPGAPPPGSQPIMIAHRKSPEDSSSSEGVPTPSTSQGTELHPAIMHPNGMIEMQPPGTILTDEQQRALEFQHRSKPEPMRADSGSHLYAHSTNLPSGPYMLHSGHVPATYPIHAETTRSSNDMNRLEALVAVATSAGAQKRP